MGSWRSLVFAGHWKNMDIYGLISWHKECNRRTTFVAEHWRFDEPRKVTKTWSIRRGPIKAIHLGASLLEQGVAKARLRSWKLNKFEHHFIPSGWNFILRCPSWNRMESLQGIFVAKRVPSRCGANAKDGSHARDRSSPRWEMLATTCTSSPDKEGTLSKKISWDPISRTYNRRIVGPHSSKSQIYLRYEEKTWEDHVSWQAWLLAMSWHVFSAPSEIMNKPPQM